MANKQNQNQTTILELELEKSAELEFRCTLLEDVEAYVGVMTITKASNYLPENPDVLFILEDRKDPTGCIHQGISALAAYLAQYGIVSHAMITSNCDDDFLTRILRQYKYRNVAYSMLTGADGGFEIDIIDKVKRILPNTRIIVGGPHVTIVKGKIMQENRHIDVAVVGEGEETLYEILTGLPLNKINGIIYKSNGMTVQNAPRAFFKSLDKLPVPLRDVYFNDNWEVHSLLTSRGCPYKCHFCSSSRIWGQILRFKPLRQIEQELQWLYENSDHSKLVVINDDMFNLKIDRTLKMMEIFKRYPFKFFARGCRADRVTAEVAKAMKDAGVNGCGIGIESADNESLKLMRKNETIEEIERGINHLMENGIAVAGQFIIGNIGDTLKSVKKSVEFAKKLDSAAFYSAVLYPGTPLTDYVLTNNYLLDKAVNVYDDSPSTQIFFETPLFPLKDRIEAIKVAYEAGFIARFPADDTAPKN